MPEGRSARAASSSQSARNEEVLTIDEMIERYYGEWILMRVLERDEDYFPMKGQVVLHAKTKAELLKAEAQAPPAIAGQPYYTFPAIPDITSGPIYEREVKRFIGQLIGSAMRAYRGRA
jgi:hypothetical protein